MTRIPVRPPSPALVVAMLALVLAVGGSAYAAGAVKFAKKAGYAQRAGKARKAGFATNAGYAAAATLSQITYKSETFPSPPTTSSSPGNDATVGCDPGQHVTGGGAKLDNEPSQIVNDSGPVGSSGWEVHVYNNDTAAHAFTVYAICTRAVGVSP